MDRNKIPHEPRYLGVPSGVSKTISKPMGRSTQTVHLSCVKISTISKWTEASFHFSLVTSENYQVRPEQFVRLAQTMHLPCTNINTNTNTVSKWTETKFDMTHIT
jgi:hypothetical protein